MELFRKVIIKTEEDLPKEKGKYYYFHAKNEPILRLILYCAKNDDIELLPKYYIEDYDFWLEYIETNDADIEAWANEQPFNPNRSELTSIQEAIVIAFHAGLRVGAKAVINGEIKHIKK